MTEQSHIRRSTRMTFRAVVSVLGATIATVALACSGADRTTGIVSPSNDTYASLRFNVHTVTMSTVAPYDTLQLSTTAHTVSGAVASGLGTPTFTVSDTTLTVSPAGLVKARTSTFGSFVVASLRDAASNVTRADTVYIAVTDTTPTSPLATFSIRRTAADTMKVGVGSPDTLYLVATAANGSDLLPMLPPATAVRFTTSDANTGTVTTSYANTGIVTGMQPGKVTIKAATTYYGVTLTDSVEVTIGNPVIVNVTVNLTASPIPGGGMIRAFGPTVITIGVGGTVIFSPVFGSPVQWDVVFDDPSEAQPSILVPQQQAATGTGNIGPLSVLPDLTGGFADLIKICFPRGLFGPDAVNMCSASRSFARAGTYHYHSALYGTSGKIIVQGP